MANSVAIPQDIIDNIIEAVGNDRALLKTCALVSSSFLFPSRKHLFSHISLGGDHQARQRLEGLYQFLVENPAIQSFVRSIAIIGNPLFKSRSLIIAILRLSFCCLESFSIGKGRYNSNLKWIDFSNEPKDAVLTIIHSSTLKTLCLDEVSVPIMFFHGIHVTKLELRSFVLNDFDGEKSRLLTSAASEGVTSHTVVDQCVWTFHGTVHGPSEPIFLPFMCRLRVFTIYINSSFASIYNIRVLSFLMRSLRVSLTPPATLEHLKFDIVFTGYDDYFDYRGFFGDLCHADVWSHLDSIITHPTGSRLQRVDININYPSSYDDYESEPDANEVMQLVLDALPLLREKGILFVEAHVDG